MCIHTHTHTHTYIKASAIITSVGEVLLDFSSYFINHDAVPAAELFLKSAGIS